MATATQPVQVDKNVTQFVAKPRQMLINGKWVNAASGKTFPTYNPATGEVLAHVAEGDKEDINRAVDAARAAFDKGPWRKLAPSERGRLIWKLADLIEKHFEEFAQLECLDKGKPLFFARVADIPTSIDQLRYYAGLGHENRRKHDSAFDAGRREVFRVHAARADRRGRADHPVEFPDDYGRL